FEQGARYSVVIKLDAQKRLFAPDNILKKPSPPEGDGRGRKKAPGLKSGFQHVQLASLPGGSSAALHNVLIGHGQSRVRSESIRSHYVKAGQRGNNSIFINAL
ncbi:MAG TPA: hypothetical protein VIH61_00940, partial [Waddliaceae bacterium]